MSLYLGYMLMDYRKLISFGKNSFVVSLPKSWIRQNNLQKGALIYVDEREKNLILSTEERQKVDEKTKNILVDGKSIRRLKREIISAYIKDYKNIILTGDELKDKAVQIQNTIQNLMALEVMEQTSKRIVARDFLDMNSISIMNLIRKIDVIIRAMYEDCENMFTDDNYDSIYHRDNDVNRLSFLIFRVIEFGLNNSSFMYKKHGLTSQRLLTFWWCVSNLEKVGDEVKRVARYMKGTLLEEKEKKRFLKILASMKDGYLKVMKGFYTEDIELTHDVLEQKEDVVLECESYYNDNKDVENVALLMERFKAMVTNIYSLGRSIYQSYLFDDKEE